MKKLIISIACLGVLGLSGSAMAAPPAKATILHCGCEDNVGMVFTEISVSTHARGHAVNHVVTEDPEFVRLDECLNGDGVEATFVQTDSDCVTGDSAAGLDGLLACADGQAAGDICGAEMIPQPE